jgi:hypothetical protein
LICLCNFIGKHLKAVGLFCRSIFTSTPLEVL